MTDFENFERELTSLLNAYCQEKNSNTPDFILARYILNCLNAFNVAVFDRERWYGREKPREPTLVDMDWHLEPGEEEP